MALSLYDFEGNQLGFTDKIISSYRDASWNDVGTSEFHFEKDEELISLITENKYIFFEDENAFQDIIVGYELRDDFTVYCRSLSWLLTKMIIPPTTFKGTVSECVQELLSISKGCDIALGAIPEIEAEYSIKTDEATIFSDTLKLCLDSAYSGHSVRFSHADKSFYLDILVGNNLDFYVSENDCTLESLSLNHDIIDFANSVCFKNNMKYMGQWNPSSNSPSLNNENKSNFSTYYKVSSPSGSYTRFDISWSDGSYIYSDTSSGKWKKSTTPPEDFYSYYPDSSVSDKYIWYHISSKENKEQALNDHANFNENNDFSAVSRNLTFLKDYRLGDFVKLQYRLNNSIISVPCQFSSVIINRDNIDNTENPTLKEVK